MKLLRKLLSGCIAFLIINIAARAQTNIEITLSSDGLLSWTNANTNLFYTIEWRPSLNTNNPWIGSYRGLQDVRSSMPVVTVPVPMFFRLAASSNQMQTLTLSPTNSNMPEGYYSATNLSSVDPDLSPTNIKLGTDIFGVPGALIPSGGTATPADVWKNFLWAGSVQLDSPDRHSGNLHLRPGVF